jgi:hypothetical protein
MYAERPDFFAAMATGDTELESMAKGDGRS